MGAWGDGPFDNDEAADWAAEFDGVSADGGLSLIASALAVSTVSVDDYVDADAGVLAVAAAELVAFIRGRPGLATPYNETPRQWIERAQPQATSETSDRALAALRRVTGPKSELAELWDEAGAEWRASIVELEARLAG